VSDEGRVQNLQVHGPSTRIDARCLAAARHVGCTCTASSMQPVDYTILRFRAHALAMQGLQSERYAVDPAFRDAVRAVFAMTSSVDESTR